MDIIEAIKSRRSIRAYKSDPVPRDILRNILETACRAPSAMNTQPWECTVVSGSALANIARDNVAKLRAGEMPNPEHHVVGWTQDSVHRQRQVELAIQIFKIMDVPREDKVKRMEWMERGFRNFDAPAMIIISVDRSLSETGPVLDVGAVMQNICLAAMQYGLGTCIHDQGVMYPETLRQYAGIPESKRIMIAVAIGYPDEKARENTIASTRVPIDDIITWQDF